MRNHRLHPRTVIVLVGLVPVACQSKSSADDGTPAPSASSAVSAPSTEPEYAMSAGRDPMAGGPADSAIGGLGDDEAGIGLAIPKPRLVSLGKPTVKGGLPYEVIRRIMRQNMGRFIKCYQTGLDKSSTLQGEVTLTFTIDAQGAVATVEADKNFPDQSVATCMAMATKGLSFPQPEGGGVANVTFPIELTLPKEEAKP